VNASSTAPITTNEAKPCAVRKPKAWRGSSACSTTGFCAICQTPTAPSAANHSRHTGPKNAPTTAVPWRWIMNSAISTTATIGSTQGLKALVPTSSPSTADTTEIAGVSTASPKNSDAPNRPTVRMKSRPRGRFFTAALASAISAIVPPSPRLSARITSTTYLSDTTMISTQKMADRPPRMLATLSGMPCPGAKVSFTAYSGLVPMSP
jgi:hypothetical protein